MKRILALVLLCLPALADDAAVDALIDKLAAEDPAARQAAFEELVKLGATAEPRRRRSRSARIRGDSPCAPPSRPFSSMRFPGT
jgi:hypothetical protein